LIPLFNIRVPPASAVFLKKFFEIASFDLVPVDKIWNKIFYMPPSHTLDLRFAQLGIEEACLIGNIGSVSLSLLAIGLLLLLAEIVERLKRTGIKRIKMMWKKISKKAFWNAPTTVFLESFMIVVLASLLKIKYSNW